MTYSDMGAGFASLFTSEDKIDSMSIERRTGLLSYFGGVLVFWSPKLQSEITLSTLGS